MKNPALRRMTLIKVPARSVLGPFHQTARLPWPLLMI
jgi:hypothetical protein